LPYLEKIEKEAVDGFSSRPIFTSDYALFKVPMWSKEESLLGLKVKMQKNLLSLKQSNCSGGMNYLSYILKE